MNCKKIRKIILTDYLDDQMGKKEKLSIEKHLSDCRSCREFALNARKACAEMFTNTGKANPPEFVWRRIREAIIAKERKKENFAVRFLEKIKYAFYIPNPAIAFATIVALMLIFGGITKLMVANHELLKDNAQEQVEYLDYSMEIPADASANDEAGFGTSIEKYFL